MFTLISPGIKKYFSSYSGLSKYCWQHVGLSFIDSVAVGLIFFVSLYFVKDLHFTVSMVGMAMSCYAIGTACGGILSGRLSDKIPGSRLVMVSMTLQSIALFILVHVSTLKWVAIDMLFFGIATYAFKTANNVWVLRYSLKHESVKLKVVNILYSAANFGNGVAAALVGILVGDYGFKSIFYISSAALLLGAIYSFIIERNAEIDVNEKIIKASSDTIVRRAENRKVVFLMLGCLFLVGVVIAQLSTTYGIFLHDTFPKLGVKAVSILFIVNTVIIIFLQTPIVNLFRKTNKIVLVAFGAFFYSFGMFMLSFSWVFGLALLACVVRTMGEMFFYSVAQLVCYQHTSQKNKGLIIGVFQTTFAVSIIIGSSLGGVIPPILRGFKSRSQATMANFCFGVIPPMAMLGRS